MAMVTTDIEVIESGRLPVAESVTQNEMSVRTPRMMNDFPARSSLMTFCSRPAITSMSCSSVLNTRYRRMLGSALAGQVNVEYIPQAMMAIAHVMILKPM